MREEHVYIKNNELVIEGLLYKSSQDRGVVICHPHPLLGGSMYNNVVEAIRDAFAAENYSTLRFNFRGVGTSTGTYDEGRGEQEDILASYKYLQNLGILKISFVGYSFGAWIGSKVVEQAQHPFNSVKFVSPPINYFEFNFTKLRNKVNIIICGDNDQFCDLDVLKKQIKYLDSNLKIITETDHFYSGKENELINLLRKSLNNQKK
jgi:uncharacterized protein